MTCKRGDPVERTARGHAHEAEEDDTDGAHRGSARGEDAQHPGDQRERHGDPRHEDDLAVRAEGLDGERLGGLGRGVDEDPADRDERRCGRAGQRGHEVPDAQREAGGEDAREGGRGEGGGDGARVGLHGRSCAAPHRLDHSGTEEPLRGGVELLGVVFLFAGFLVSIEVFREIRIPFTHRVLHVRHAGA
jgi:hypothetical protein